MTHSDTRARKRIVGYNKRHGLREKISEIFTLSICNSQSHLHSFMCEGSSDQQNKAATMQYQIPDGMHVISPGAIDMRSDLMVDADLANPKPIVEGNEKNIWFFWHNGYSGMHEYCQRNVRAWHRRFSRLGWVVRVVDRKPGSPLNISNFLDIADPSLFPAAFTENTLSGTYALQHSSDLVRWPLLLRYGGVYADVGMMQIGDLDRLWNETVGNPKSPYTVLSYQGGDDDEYALTNYFLCSNRGNPLFQRAHDLFLALWAEEGGKVDTVGMHKSPLLEGVPMMTAPAFTEEGKTYDVEEASALLTDYIIQGQALTMAMSAEDPRDGWNGPEYVRTHVYAIEFMVGAQLINDLTKWDGSLAYALMSLPLPRSGEAESDEQKKAKAIVKSCLSRSFGFKLATGLILRVLGDTLSSLWRQHIGSDNVPGTYAHWLRYGIVHWNQNEVPSPIEWKPRQPIKMG
jgi:hypothetical protein